MVVAGVWTSGSKASAKAELALKGYCEGNSSEEPEPSESWLAMSGCSMVELGTV